MEIITQNTKELALKVISELPSDSTIEDIFYALYVQNKIECGLHDVSNNETVSNETAAKELEQWLNI